MVTQQVKRMMLLLLLAGMLFLGNVLSAENNVADKNKDGKKKTIDLVFAIDVSGSMDHIITAAQKKVWAIVNQMASVKPMPSLRIGLIAYRGQNEECFGGTGFKCWDLSENLDLVYKQLMSLSTDGGATECVGRAIYEATNSMSWDKSKDGLKVLFVLGNEPANQDPDQEKYGYKKVASDAIKQNISINTVYCAQGAEGATPEWKEIAALSDGAFSTISLEGRVVEIATPMDKEIVLLNGKLNNTYMAYGARGRKSMELQQSMDSAANSVSGSAAPAGGLAERAVAKSGNAYRSGDWDLVDRSKDKDFKMEDVKDEELPDEMKKMSMEERKAYIEKKIKEREEVQKQIRELGEKREQYIKEEMKKQKLVGDEFDQVIMKTLREQAEKKGFEFEKEKK